MRPPLMLYYFMHQHQQVRKTDSSKAYVKKSFYQNVKGRRGTNSCKYRKSFRRHNQFLVVRSVSSRTSSRQVSWLISNNASGRLPGFPVTSWPTLLNYSDEIVQDLHLFPFSPDPALAESDTCCFLYSITETIPHTPLFFNTQFQINCPALQSMLSY